MKFEDVKEGSIVYLNQHEVHVEEKGYDPDDNSHYVLYTYVNLHDLTPRGFQRTGISQLKESPLHCWNCVGDIVDRFELEVCRHCARTICPKCHCCHCETPWDRRGKQIK